MTGGPGGVVVGVDVGGTKVLGVEVDGNGGVRRTARAATPGRTATPEEIEDALTRVVADVADGRPVAAVGVSAAALVGADGGVRFATHLPWREQPVREQLEQRWQVPVVVENDASCALVAEQTHGAARGVEDVVLITVGTGIGGAISIGGRLVRGRQGMAGELGHQQVVPQGLPCECGLLGCWEQYASGNALVRLVARTRPDLTAGADVTAAARAGDGSARQAFASVGDWLGVGTASLVAVLDPALVLVGGGVSEAGDLLLHPARAALRRALYAADHREVPPLLPTAMGPEAGAVGAAQLAYTRAPSSPGSRGSRGIFTTR